MFWRTIWLSNRTISSSTEIQVYRRIIQKSRFWIDSSGELNDWHIEQYHLQQKYKFIEGSYIKVGSELTGIRRLGELND